MKKERLDEIKNSYIGNGYYPLLGFVTELISALEESQKENERLRDCIIKIQKIGSQYSSLKIGQYIRDVIESMLIFDDKERTEYEKIINEHYRGKLNLEEQQKVEQLIVQIFEASGDLSSLTYSSQGFNVHYASNEGSTTHKVRYFTSPTTALEFILERITK